MDSLFHGSPLLQTSVESLRDADEVVLDVASELNMEDTHFVKTPLSCSDVSVHSETSTSTVSSPGIIRTPEDQHIKDEPPRVSQICPSGVLFCWILTTFAAIVVIVLSSDYGRHLHSEITLHEALVESTLKEEFLLNKSNEKRSVVNSSTVHSFLKRNATVNNSNTETLGAGDVKNTSSMEEFITEERDWYVDSPTEIVSPIETVFLEEKDEESVFEEFYVDELSSPQILDESTPSTDPPITQTHASAPTMTSDNGIKIDTATLLSVEEDFDVFEDVFPSFANEDDWISSYKEALEEEAEGSLISAEPSQRQLFSNTEVPIRQPIQPNWWIELSPQVHEEDFRSVQTTNEDLIFEHNTLQLIDEVEMDAEVSLTSAEYTDSAHSVPFDVIDSQANTSSALVTEALQNEQTITRTQASSTLNQRNQKPSIRIAIVAILCGAFILLVALYLKRKAFHWAVNRDAQNSFSHDSSQTSTTTPSVKTLSWRSTLEAQDKVGTSPTEAETERVSSRNAKLFHFLRGHLIKPSEFLNRNAHKRKIQPSPHTPATFHLDSLPPELWAIRLHPYETTP